MLDSSQAEQGCLNASRDEDEDEDEHRNTFDNENLPSELDSFAKSMQFGRERLRAALLIGLRPEPFTAEPDGGILPVF